jgi:hypothetical protein
MGVPIPAVLMKISGPPPRPMTLVSPATMRTPAASAAALAESRILRSVAIGNPWDSTRPKVR